MKTNVMIYIQKMMNLSRFLNRHRHNHIVFGSTRWVIWVDMSIETHWKNILKHMSKKTWTISDYQIYQQMDADVCFLKWSHEISPCHCTITVQVNTYGIDKLANKPFCGFGQETWGKLWRWIIGVNVRKKDLPSGKQT